MKDFSPNATGFFWRSAEYMVYAQCFYYDEDNNTIKDAASSKAVAKGYLDRWFSKVHPYCNGGSYVNFIDPLLGDRGDEVYYGSNLGRLRRLKRDWNPRTGRSPLHFAMEIQDDMVTQPLSRVYTPTTSSAAVPEEAGARRSRSIYSKPKDDVREWV